MCTSKPEARPGLDGLLDYVDVLLAVQSKVDLVLNLAIDTPLSHDGKSNFTDNEVATLCGMLRDLLDDAWAASDGIYALYRKEVAHEPQK
jgi:hypothetical protein